jgi:hypothetical protein
MQRRTLVVAAEVDMAMITISSGGLLPHGGLQGVLGEIRAIKSSGWSIVAAG